LMLGLLDGPYVGFALGTCEGDVVGLIDGP